MDASALFIAGLIERVPELAPAMREHQGDNDELLPHVFMGDVARYVIAHGREPAVLHVLDHMETGLHNGDPQVGELIGASFVENLTGEFTTLKLLGPDMGRLLKAEVDKVCGHS